MFSEYEELHLYIYQTEQLYRYERGNPDDFSMDDILDATLILGVKDDTTTILKSRYTPTS